MHGAAWMSVVGILCAPIEGAQRIMKKLALSIYLGLRAVRKPRCGPGCKKAGPLALGGLRVRVDSGVIGGVVWERWQETTGAPEQK